MPSIHGAILIFQYLILILLPFIIFLFHRYQILNKKDIPPSPPRLPIIGNLHQLSKFPYRSLQSLSQKYGDIMMLQLGSRPTLIVSSREAAAQVLKTHDVAFCSKPRWSNFTRILYNGKGVIAAPYGDYWRHLRSICVHELLSKSRVHSFSRIRQEEVTILADNIKRAISTSSTTSSSIINLRELFLLFANDLICRVVIGMRRKRDDQGNDDGFDMDVDALITEIVLLVGRFSVGDFVPWLSWIDRFNGDGARVERVIKTLDDFLESVLEKHSIDHKAKENMEECGDFVDILLQLQKDCDASGQVPLDRDSIKALLLDMFLAGSETSSTTLEWMMSEILLNAYVLEKLQKEVREASKGKDVITDNELKNMVYLKAVLQETLRLHPPAPLLSPRESIQDVQINGYNIAAGTLLFVNGRAIGRDPRNWDEPDRFYPERFLSSSIISRARQEFDMIPFGSGRRNCLGESFAISSIELAMANLLLIFDWKLQFGEERERLGMQDFPGITIKRRTPLLAIATYVREPSLSMG